LQRVFGMGELQARINGAILTSQPKYVALSLLNHGKVSRKSRAGRRSGQSDCGIDQRTQSCSLGGKASSRECTKAILSSRLKWDRSRVSTAQRIRKDIGSPFKSLATRSKQTGCSQIRRLPSLISGRRKPGNNTDRF
jgi:hypothetical protein